MADSKFSFVISQGSWSRIQERIVDHVRVSQYFPQDPRIFVSHDEYTRRVQGLRFRQWADKNPEMLSRLMYADHLLNPTAGDLIFETWKMAKHHDPSP